MRTLLLVLLASAALPARADPPAPALAEEALPLPPPPPPVEATAPRSDGPGVPRFGLLLDAGVPDGVAVAAVFRPVEAVRFTFGPSYNGLGLGLQAGVGLVPFRWIVNPSLDLEAGRYFEADLTWLADRRGVPDELRPLLRHVSYGYVSGHLGLELGSDRGLTFFLRAGLTYVATTARGTARSTATSGPSAGTTVEIKDPKLTGTMPSVKLGLLLYF